MFGKFDKPRLYVATYFQGTSTPAHWAFLIGPKHETAPNAIETWRHEVWHIHHAPDEAQLLQLQRQQSRERPYFRRRRSSANSRSSQQPPSLQRWEYNAEQVANQTGGMLVRVLIGKVEDQTRLQTLLENVAIRQGDPGWNCASWIGDSLRVIARDGRCVGRASITDWTTVGAFVVGYTDRKRIEGRFRYDPERPGVPTFDLTRGKELN